MFPVAALYRVSTQRQVKKHLDGEETLPMQRQAIRRFIESRPGWHIVPECEYAEEGVSAWTNSSEERDVLQQILKDARAGLFKVLVIFKYDRLSRISLEYPLLLSQLRRMGVAVWSVADDGSGRELKIDGQADKLLRFIEGWQAETESYNTSIRVKEKMRQLAEKGLWTGGKVPYGFSLRNGGRTKTGNPLSLEKNPKEADWIKEMFYLYLECDIGTTRIAEIFNDKGYRLRNGKLWRDSDIRRVMKNPIVAGRPAYGRTYNNHLTNRQNHRPFGSPEIILAPEIIPEYAIIPWDDWCRAMEKMHSYNKKEPDGSVRYSKAFTGPLLLTGLLRCGHCGGSIAAGHSLPKHTWQDGKIVQYRYPRYRCQTKYTRGKSYCDGQGSYSARRLDEAVLSVVKQRLVGLQTAEIIREVRFRIEQNLWSRSSRRQLSAKRYEKAERLYQEWTKRLNQFLLNSEKSMYSEEFIAERIKEAEVELNNARTEHARLEKESEDINRQLADFDDFIRRAPDWWQHFLAAPREKQKNLLRQVIKKVVVWKNEIEIHWRIDLNALVGSEGAVEWKDNLAWSRGKRKANL